MITYSEKIDGILKHFHFIPTDFNRQAVRNLLKTNGRKWSELDPRDILGETIRLIRANEDHKTLS